MNNTFLVKHILRLASQIISYTNDPKPKFKIYEKVIDDEYMAIGGEKIGKGEIISIGQYDSLIDGYRYKVRTPSGNKWWNENKMKKASKTADVRVDVRSLQKLIVEAINDLDRENTPSALKKLRALQNSLKNMKSSSRR